jgi:hypothetical protein
LTCSRVGLKFARPFGARKNGVKKMRSNAQKKTANLVPSANKKRLIVSHFTPLPEAKVAELKDLLTTASKTKAVKQDPSLNKALQRTLGSINKYNQMIANESLGKECADAKTALQKDIYKNIKAYSKKSTE